MPELYVNTAKERLLKGEKLSAGWIQTGSPMASEIMAQSGFDILVVDGEHGPVDPSNLIPILHAMNGYGVMPMVRAPWNDFVSIKRLLDCGAMGIHIPYVNTPEEAAAAVSACKYPPEGIRGIAGSPRAAGYGANLGNYLQRANDQMLVMIALETPQSVQNLDLLMDVKGVDGIFIGPTDLSTTHGYFANAAHPEMQKIIRGIEDKVLARGDKLLATIASSASAAKELYMRGYSYVIFASDGVTLRTTVSEMIKEFKNYINPS